MVGEGMCGTVSLAYFTLLFTTIHIGGGQAGMAGGRRAAAAASGSSLGRAVWFAVGVTGTLLAPHRLH